jgi:hypothetical protein
VFEVLGTGDGIRIGKVVVIYLAANALKSLAQLGGGRTTDLPIPHQLLRRFCFLRIPAIT